MSNKPETQASTGQNPNLARGNYPLSINTRNWTFFWLKNKQKIRLIYNRFVCLFYCFFETVFFERKKKGNQ
jgi:hypothetical protein